MYNFPIERYKIYTTPDNKTIAISTYAGKTVRGVAKTDPRDEFNAEYGRKLAAARCAVKIAKKRRARAEKMLKKAQHKMNEVCQYVERMKAYDADAKQDYSEAVYSLKEIENED